MTTRSRPRRSTSDAAVTAADAGDCSGGGEGAPVRRMAREQRRELMLAAATAMVAERGFAGVSTDDVAQAAGVSQPYVVQMFGSKAQLLAAVFERTTERVLTTFAAVPAGSGAKEGMSAAYMGLVQDGDLLRVLVHGLCAGTDPVIGSSARAVLTETVRLFQERTGSDLRTARDFLAHGMLINVLLVAAAPAHLHESPQLEELSRITMGSALVDSASTLGHSNLIPAP